ncbi:MAG: sulfate adenylyltransferase subunit 1 [Schleiferiaceae bacterium]
MNVLRFTTAGSVDDGKSTLIGRLLYDSKSVFIDQLDAVAASSKRRGTELDLSLLTDGLKDEREQGITIDVAYRYFATPKRNFILADTPGHVQYTRNMVTGASTADAALILVDARHGVVEQTRRHSFIAGLLGLKAVVVCVNKMDLVDYAEAAFTKVCADYEAVRAAAGLPEVHFVPLSALVGDNVVDRSAPMNWYSGPTLLELLETLEPAVPEAAGAFRFPVQTVIRPRTTEHHDFRGYAGRVAGGRIAVGDTVTVWPEGLEATVEGIFLGSESLHAAEYGQSVVITLDRDVNVARGSVLTSGAEPQREATLRAKLCWLDAKGHRPGVRYEFRAPGGQGQAMIAEVERVLNLETLNYEPGEGSLEANQIAEVTVRCAQAPTTEVYSEQRTMGGFILVDPVRGATVAAGMIQ